MLSNELAHRLRLLLVGSLVTGSAAVFAQESPEKADPAEAGEMSTDGEIDAESQARVTMIDREIEGLRSMIGELETEAFDLRAQLDDGTSDDPIDAEMQLEDLQSRLENLEDDLNRLEQERQTLVSPELDADVAARREEALQALRAAREAGGNLADDDDLPPDGTFRFGPFSEPVEIMILINIVREELGLNMLATDPSIEGQTVVIPNAIDIPRENLLSFLTFLLEDKQFTLLPDDSGVIAVVPVSSVVPGVSTRIFRTDGLRPTALQSLMAQIAKNNNGGVLYLDEFGVIVMTGTQRQLDSCEEIIRLLNEEKAMIEYRLFELEHVTADHALTRILELFSAQPGRVQRQGNQGEGARPVVASGTIVDLPTKLHVDTQSNSLIFFGRPDETVQLEKLISLVDRPNVLISKWYPVGAEAARITAAAGQNEGLGSVNVDSGSGTQGSSALLRNQQAQRVGGQQQFAPGPGFTVYPQQGGFMYSGTESQHQRVSELVDQFSILEDNEVVVYEFYKLKHSNAADVAGIIQNLIANTAPSGNTGLLGQDLSRRNQTQPPAEGGAQANTGDTGGAVGEIEFTEDINVLPDEQNNQVVVKAPRAVQPQFKRLIEKLDLKRPQVYIEAMIVTVTHDDSFRFAVETQGIFGQFGLQTVFSGLTTGGDDFLSPRNVETGLGGITAALIRSDSVPLVINALASDTDARIVATPSLLVDDNEEATITSLEGQPTTTVTQGDATTNTSFGGFEEAGPELTVTPHISEGGYVRLEYNITLSSFIGVSSSPGIPPPRLDNSVSANSVRVPSDSTIVVGGLTFDTEQKTVAKIPLLGDIPLVGELFKDTSVANSKTTLFVFITPRIMRDDNFTDLRLLSKGPAMLVGANTGLPLPEPVTMELTPMPSALLEPRPEDPEGMNE